MSATIVRLAIFHGKADLGGGIANLDGALDQAVLAWNESARGGAIYNAGGALQVSHSNISHNGAFCHYDSCLGNGGGIATQSPLPVTIVSSVVNGNRAICDGEGCRAIGGAIE